MEIIIFSPYYPPHIGGLESHADEFNKYLSLQGIDISVFTPRLPQDAPEFETRYNNVKIIRFPAFEIIPNYPLPRFWSLRFYRLFFALFGKKYSVVISRTRFFATSLLALFYAKIRHIKWVHIEHGSDFVKTGGKISVAVARIYDHIFGKLIFKVSDQVVANSYASADFCKKIAKDIDCEVIYRGVETKKILSAPPALELKNKYPDKIIITFLGRLFNGKGVADLVSALARIDNKNYVCFIIGDGPEKERLENLAKKINIKDKIIFFGFKNFDEYIKILKITDIFVNPSYTEGLPTTVAEAALCKNAIIASDVGGTREIITDQKSGLLLEPKNIPALKEKLEMLIDDKDLRRQLAENAFEEFGNKFSWENSIKKYTTILKTL